MSNHVKSNNTIIELLVSATYYPVFCGKTMEFSQSQEVIEVTSVNSGVDRDYEAGMTTANLSITGVTILNNNENRIAIAYLMQQSIRRVPQTMRIRLIDDDGNAIQILFSALITNNTLSRSVGTYSQSSTTMTITGPISFSSIIPPPTPAVVQPPLYLNFPAGATSVDDPLLTALGVVILEVQREGLGHDQTSGTPGNRQFRFVALTGTIEFDPTNPSNGETVYVLYEK